MDVIRCKNGHFFDGDSYDKCPHCGEAALTGSNAQMSLKEEKKGFWGRGKKDKETAAQKPISTSHNSYRTDYDNGSSPTEVNNDNSLVDNSPSPQHKDHTLDFWQTSSHSDGSTGSKQNLQEESDKSAVVNETKADTGVNGTISSKNVSVGEEERNSESSSASSLKEAVKNASASNEGKTMSYFSSATAPSVPQNQTHQPAEPVVGWLVCIKGYHFGECFSIYAGKNSIGRSSENRIVIASDNSISRVKHALIVYEPKKRNFYIQPGDSSGLTYLNDDYITESHKLSAHDMIELGDSKFIFVPLCGETFSWEEYIPKGE